MNKIKIQTFTGEDLFQYIEDLAALEIEVFKSYPYLYDVSMEYEKEYLTTTYAESEQSAVAIAFDGGKVVGASTCIPMNEAEEGVKKPFIQSSYPVEKVLYLGESVLQKSYRAKGIGVAFFKHREDHARQLNMEYTAFCSIIRPENHPLKPKKYKSLHQYWINRGYQIEPDMKATMIWKDVHQLSATKKELVFWVKKL